MSDGALIEGTIYTSVVLGVGIFYAGAYGLPALGNTAFTIPAGMFSIPTFTMSGGNALAIGITASSAVPITFAHAYAAVGAIGAITYMSTMSPDDRAREARWIQDNLDDLERMREEAWNNGWTEDTLDDILRLKKEYEEMLRRLFDL